MDFGNYFPLYFPLLIAADNGSKRIAPADADAANDLSSLALASAKRLSVNVKNSIQCKTGDTQQECAQKRKRSGASIYYMSVIM